MFAGHGGHEALWRDERKDERDFRRARRGAFLRRLGRRLKRRVSGIEVCCEGCCDSLACFGEEGGDFRKSSAAKREFETVEVEGILGSVGRCREFDGDFLPVCSCSRDRWERVNRAFGEGRLLPPVELYKVEERYFVSDGNHRISVARHHGVAAVDAVVTEFTVW